MRNTYIRNQFIDGVGPFHWLEGDNGTWDGPSENWPSHKALWTQHIKQYRTCVQAGGALGMYPKLLATMFKHVHTFEPTTESFEVLLKNCEGLTNVTMHTHALGQHDGWVEIQHHDSNNVGANQLKNTIESRAGVGNANVRLVALDSFELTDVDFLQLDVECYELNVLKGAQQLIRKCRPIISCENGNGSIMEFLKQYGYAEVGKSHADTCYSPINYMGS